MWVRSACSGAALLAGALCLLSAHPGYAAEDPKAAPAIKIDEAPGEARLSDSAAKEKAAKLTADTMATQPKPKGFRYTIVRDRWVEDVSETLLYVKKSPKAKSSRAIPIPKDRKLLAECIEGGGLAELKRGAVVTARFDPKGVVRPKITIAKKVQVEILHGKVIDIGGPKLYVVLDDGARRGFEVGSYADWDKVVQNGKATDLKRQAGVTIRFDPSGETDIEVVLDVPPTAKTKQADGCGCNVVGAPRGLDLGGPLGVLLMCLFVIGWRRGLSRRA